MGIQRIGHTNRMNLQNGFLASSFALQHSRLWSIWDLFCLTWKYCVVWLVPKQKHLYSLKVTEPERNKWFGFPVNVVRSWLKGKRKKTRKKKVLVFLQTVLKHFRQISLSLIQEILHSMYILTIFWLNANSIKSKNNNYGLVKGFLSLFKQWKSPFSVMHIDTGDKHYNSETTNSLSASAGQWTSISRLVSFRVMFYPDQVPFLRDFRHWVSCTENTRGLTIHMLSCG